MTHERYMVSAISINSISMTHPAAIVIEAARLYCSCTGQRPLWNIITSTTPSSSSTTRSARGHAIRECTCT